MNPRIMINIVLSVASVLVAAGLLLHGFLFIPSLSAPGRGILFEGAALDLLALGLLGVAAFAGAIARAWLRGDIPLPPPGTIRPDAVYRGRIMRRFWPALAVIVLGIGGALFLSRRTTPGADPAHAPAAARTTDAHRRGR
jgi:hypothetical protein